MSEAAPTSDSIIFPYHTWEDEIFGGFNVYHAPMIFIGNLPTHGEAVEHMKACLAECECHLCEYTRKHGTDG